MKNSKRMGVHALSAAALCLIGIAGPCPTALASPPPIPKAARSLQAAPERPFTVTGSQVRVIRSKAGRTYRAYVWVPDQPAAPSGRPIIYVLDGETTFMLVRDIARSLAVSYPASDLPVVVALAYDNAEPFSAAGLGTTKDERTYDYTPAVAKERLGASFDDRPWPPTGGADAFLDFLMHELKPSIEADVAVDPNRQTLMGHSFGGLFTLHVFFNCNECFSTYVASSPSLWYGSRHIEQVAEQFLANRRTPLQGKRLLITVGGLEQTRAPERGESARAEWLAQSRMVDGNREFAARLQSLRTAGLDVQFRVFDGETHLSVKPVAANYGMRFAMQPVPDERTRPEAIHSSSSSHPAYTIPLSAQWLESIEQGEHVVSALFPALPGSERAPAAGYPIVYVLGSGQNFGILADTLRRLEGAVVEPAILIGIDEPALLPTLHRRIVARLQSRFPIDASRRMLIGYGNPANTVLQTLYTQPDLFDIYAALSPPASAIEQHLRAGERDFPKTFHASGKRLLLTAGDAAGNDFPSGLQQPQGEDRTAFVLQDLSERLRTQIRGIDLKLQVLDAEDNTFSTAAFAEALLFELSKTKPSTTQVKKKS